jgi:carboxylate-amine ligase
MGMDAQRQAPWAEWQNACEPFTVGIEEEAMLVDRRGWGLDQEFGELRERLTPELSARLSTETHGATIEFESRPCRHSGEAGEELAELRVRLSDELGEFDHAAAAAGTHPFATWEETEITPERRYRYVHESMRELARREPTFATHVHVAVSDPELAVATANRMRAHLPLLLALSANSPFWQGRDSGMASARTPIFQAFPRVGLPRRFSGYADYVDTLDTLIACGAFPEPTFVWWDLRLQPRLGTIEIRIMDAQSEVWRTATLAALTQSLVRLEALEGEAPEALTEAPELLEENRFRAARDGVRAELLDPVGRRALAVGGLAELAVEASRPHARELGCEAELDRVAELVEHPADETQRELAAEHDLTGVVAALSSRFSEPVRAGAGRSPARNAGPRRSR